MKKLYFLTFLFLCTFLTIGTNTAWGETETITFTNKDWIPWTNITSGSSFESSNLARGVANNGVSGSCKSPKMYNNITKIELVCSSNTTGGSVAVLVGTSQVGSQKILKSNNATYTYTVSDLSGLVTIKVGKPSSKSVWVKSIAITYETSTSSCTQLSTPTNLAVKNITSSTADISWDAVPNATKYKVTCIGDDATIEKEVSATSDQLTGLDASSQYLWSVKAIGDGTTYCDSEESETKDFTTLASSAPCTQLPAPTELNASATTYNAATLSWNKIENATKYQITTTPPMFGGSATYTTTGTETTYTATDLSPETEYKWTVKALGNGTTYCDSKESADGTFTTPAKPKYTIIWSTPTSTDTTQVTEGSAIGTLPAAPTSCSSTYTNFVGWFTEAAGSESNPSTAKPATQVTAATVPTGDATYYAVFSDATGDGTTTVFSETFNNANGTGGNDNQWSGSIASTALDVTQCDNTSGWTVSSVYSAKACIKAGSGSKQGSVQTPLITISGNATITFLAGAWDGKDEKTTLNISATNGKLSQTSVTMKKGEWTSYTITLSDVTAGTTRLTFAAADATKNRFFLDEIKVVVSSTTPATGYISFCTPYIKGTDNITVTSGNGIWVEAVTKLKVECQNLTRNSGGTTVTITAKSLTDGFNIKKLGTTGEGTAANAPLSLVTNHGDDTYSTDLVVVYKPTQDNVKEEGKIALRVYQYDGSTDYATDTVIVRGRSLPAEFVLAAKTADGWVALPADLGTSSTDAVKEPYTISVDDGAAPTKATSAPQSALYSAAMRSIVNAIPTGLRFKAGERYLQGSTSTTTTNVWLSSTNSEQMQSWELHSSNLTDYFVRLRAAEEGRYLSYNATQGKIANYKQESRLRILPVENTCVRYDAPKLVVHTLTSTSATLRWEEIAGVNEYEYSLDNGASWQTCTGVQTMGTAIQWTLGGLETQKQYTVWVRAKVANGETNCSDYDTETFTTTNCDDVPIDLWSSATANSVTITWKAQAATATVKIYSDEEGKNEVKSVQNLSSPAKIMGLAPNTKYYFQVLADGSCASAIDNFLTESNEVSIVEWKKEAVIVDINTEVTDADEVSILVEGQKTHGTNNNVADDLFFSKYYEATGNVKLVAIYNGTKDTLPLTNVKIKLGITSWNTKEISMAEYGEYKRGHIAPDEEIILWYYVEKDATDEKIVSCVKNKINIDILNKESNVSFSGRQTLALVRGSEIIDIMGAINIKDTNVDNVKPITGNCEPSWGDIEENRTWCGTGYSLDDPTQEIELSMNRCLLVRSNKVHSGAKAVANNVGAFATFTKDEWLGRQVTKDDDNGVTESCNGFAYVADFNYNDYYTTYDSIANLEIKGNRNEDGTYTIPISKLDTMACTNLRLQLKKKGTIQATREEKVPIIIYKTTDTKNSEFFGEKLTDEVCATCDVVVRDNAQLSHIAGGKQQFRDMYVYTGSSLNIPENQTMSLDKVRMFATNDNVSYAVINNSNDAAAAISVKEVSHVKRIDGRYWYPFSLPYDCNIADIDQLNGQPLGVYGTDWGIKYYDGQRRQSEGNSTTHYGEVSKYWTMMPEDGQLKAYTGYIIGLFVPAADEPLMKSVNFPPATESAYTENASSKTTPITNWPDNLTAQPRHHGWNFVGSPYISLFGSNNTKDEGLYNTQVQMGWTDALGNQRDKDNIYVSIPNGGNTNTYTQAQASGVTIRPFSAYFVQAIDPTNGQSNTLNLTYSKEGHRTLPEWAPARTAKTDALILTELDITNGALGDNTGVLVSNVYSAEYEIGDDLTKMYAAAQKPQLYTIDAHNDKMAYQALPDVLAHAIPLGIYVPQAGNYTLSLNRYVSRLEAAEAVYLLHNGAVVANLLQSDYIVSASAKGTISGYSLDIRRAPEVVTDIVPAVGDAPYIIARDGVLAIANLPVDAIVQVYDVLGHQLLRADTPATATLQVPVPQTGVYTVVITTADGQQVLKTLLR